MPTGLIFKTLAILFAVAAALGALYALYSGIDGAGYRRGAAETEARWQAREAVQSAAYAVELRRLSENALAATQKGASDTARAVRKLNQEKAIALAQKDADLAALRDGTLRLRDPGVDSGCRAPGGGPSSPATTVAGGTDAGGGELSGPAAGFLLAEAARADALVGKYNAALSLLVSDREICR